jgi:hypothetical protein
MAGHNPDLISFQDTFESGDATVWSGGETDTASQLDVVHYSTLAGIPGMPMPYSGGAYCARWILSGGTADAFFTEADININTAVTNWVKFNVWIDPNFKTNTTADDNIVLFEANAGANESFAFGIDYVNSTDSLVWAIGTHATAATPSTDSTRQVVLGVWHTIELKMHVVTGSAAGDITLYVTEAGQEPSETADATLGSIQNAAVTEGLLGVQDHEATTNCIILMDNFQFSGVLGTSGARIYPTKERFSTVRQFVRAGSFKDDQSFHAFVGPGRVTNISWITNINVDGLLGIYDTDTAQAHLGNRKAALQQSLASESMDLAMVPFDVTRGCYVVTDSAASEVQEVIVTIDRAPNWFSDGNMQRFANKRNLAP